MVRPNQIISSTDNTLTFLMFAQSEQQVIRRVMLLNFPGKAIVNIRDLGRFVRRVELATEGMVNRYRVTVDLEEIQR